MRTLAIAPLDPVPKQQTIGDVRFTPAGAFVGTDTFTYDVFDGAGASHPTTQLVIVGEMSGIGGEIGWQFRRTS